MSEEQLSALLAKLKGNVALLEKLQAAADLDAAMAMIKEAGFDISKEELAASSQPDQTVELSDVELEAVTGGVESPKDWKEFGCRMGSCTSCGKTTN